ncbi:hypothetical protein BpHYR1_024259 [Brachionus plicatilis]|uniref:Uncharacterized protein n=1 Tax=Brachionus plicatilis TaxID=10195 RepID=A0A3M7PKK2_BRAPC|nr:hypothetical protein BpHYR1_024259 [Brachionus plicatilis]
MSKKIRDFLKNKVHNNLNVDMLTNRVHTESDVELINGHRRVGNFDVINKNGVIQKKYHGF